MSKRDIRKIKSFVRQLLIHLLKLRFSYQTDPRNHWIHEVIEFRRRINAVLEEAPSLRRKVPSFALEAWPAAVVAAKRHLSEEADAAEDVSSLDCLKFEESDFDRFLEPGFLPQPPEKI